MGSQARYNMFKIFNPEGYVKQLDFIQQTTELGNTVVGLRNKGAGVLIAHNEKRSKLADTQKKVFPIDRRSLFTFSGITNDGQQIVDYLIDKSVQEEVIKGRPIHFLDVFEDLLRDTFERTIVDGRRLYGVSGLYMAEYEGIRLVEFNPKGYAKEVSGMSIGSRAQSSRTVLEAYCSEYEKMNVEELVRVGIMALKNAHPEDDALTKENVEIWILEAGKVVYNMDAGMFLN
ncbi:20S proteasome subunit alpha [Encephalitozoon intestinalis ATCC 50506]|uniref:20S proteasome subunit alpha n=1 Tax=Encephalitozoon intestinalis (strain ATCC 50506) TaxID=876142 RepID=E0SA33_ENCIT|nr:20S proteasome subunit alpha [Encephalitozoon intestinalis ATCC 50506]ADM12655.1 20S proteasome subunit alpha [Encephalitozoon intestinalis ATCC 50506]UTX46515.1 proteasome subunit alpha type-1 [Encephalitozoon intestinalis]